ncbi:hypothetical protein NY99_22380 [Xanthomonas phaseoli pv. phaseoli]|uniref:Uncharacterized protein n=1 Tax=Xanthomonas perforans TaxID=442694 RepID=A0ABR5EKN2_XANPE|nr:hypothetical protein NY99_22380 [Xanthomonas phaseoli pv. phaseoli]KHL63013.1 hypothetical protein XEU66b_04150 [Xanthomonas euvesicatoria]KLC00640.1 hypothetical protein XP315_23915 [Xanthomonas perforans]KHF47576.1 hypothetical protein QQ30_15570 [Xanthomonas phaseoli pv. phaseoli]KHL66940.1 hypothetical protein XEU83M_04120 [Xanthomonas euvesicatoria]
MEVASARINRSGDGSGEGGMPVDCNFFYGQAVARCCFQGAKPACVVIFIYLRAIEVLLDIGIA